ncbi:MAG TPA: hypothetical protein PLT82_10500 [Candidatus Hydrogenedens sp.]|nr:hypothetical protein [Candidatus Hydrogenedens sp.]HOL21067.1 hypothetical protein [Candidatus Hydrogenedens sp.]HPP59551.1 hypothetical protein [Candidatus Hydrogenedens sp.]
MENSENIDPSNEINTNSTVDVIFFTRRKKAFKYIIASTILLTFCLWFSDRYLRLDLDETKYRIALTLENESARPILRSIAQKYSTNSELKNDSRYLQYLEFLASIEEGEEVIKLYDQIYQSSTYNVSFLINYGCRLYLLGKYEQAQRIFKEAEAFTPSNSLIEYLESATIINPLVNDETIFEHGISIIAKNNRSERPIIYPKPFWHPTLPTNTYLFYMRREECINRCISPIYRLSSDILNKINTESKHNKAHHKKTWLEELYLMGEKIGSAVDINSEYRFFTAMLSLKIKKDVLELYKNVSDQWKSELLNDKLTNLNNISSLLNEFQTFEEKRKLEFEQSKNNRIKLIWLVVSGFLEILILFIILKLISSLLKRFEKPSISFYQFPSLLYLSILIWLFLTLLLIFYFSYFENFIHNNYSFISFLWYSFLSLPLISSSVFFINKFFKKKESHKTNGHSDYTEKHIETRKSTWIRFITYFIFFIERISGILLGTYILVICFWFILFRATYHSYPYQINLVPDKLLIDEMNLILKYISIFHS